MIGLVTDSNAQLPAELVDRYGVEVVPLVDAALMSERLEGGCGANRMEQWGNGKFTRAE